MVRQRVRRLNQSSLLTRSRPESNLRWPNTVFQYTDIYCVFTDNIYLALPEILQLIQADNIYLALPEISQLIQADKA